MSPLFAALDAAVAAAARTDIDLRHHHYHQQSQYYYWGLYGCMTCYSVISPTISVPRRPPCTLMLCTIFLSSQQQATWPQSRLVWLIRATIHYTKNAAWCEVGPAARVQDCVRESSDQSVPVTDEPMIVRVICDGTPVSHDSRFASDISECVVGSVHSLWLSKAFVPMINYN